MSYNRPTPQELLERIQTEFDLYLPGSDARLRRSVENVLARVLVIVSHDLNGYIEYIANQIMVDTADAEYLERHAAIWGVSRKQGAKAAGVIGFTGTNGNTVPAGSILQRGDGLQYTLDDDVTIAAGVGSGSVTALEIGTDGNAASGTKLNLTSPVAGIQTEATVDAEGLASGADPEEDAALASRIIARIQTPPHGGSKLDYEAWAKEVPGVTRVWVYPEQLGPGTVSVTFVLDNNEESIIPTAPDVENVQTHIDGVRPITADITVFAPTAVEVDFDITLNPNTTAIQNAVKAEIQDLFTREAQPGGTLYLSRIQEAISAADGEFSHELNSPAADVEMEYGEMPVVGDFTWS